LNEFPSGSDDLNQFILDKCYNESTEDRYNYYKTLFERNNMEVPSHWYFTGSVFDGELNHVRHYGPECFYRVYSSNFFLLSQWGSSNSTDYYFGMKSYLLVE